MIKLEPSRYYFVPVHDLSRDWYLALGEPERFEEFNAMQGKSVRTDPVVEVSNVAAPVDLPLRYDRLDDFQIGMPEA